MSHHVIRTVKTMLLPIFTTTVITVPGDGDSHSTTMVQPHKPQTHARCKSRERSKEKEKPGSALESVPREYQKPTTTPEPTRCRCDATASTAALPHIAGATIASATPSGCGRWMYYTVVPVNPAQDSKLLRVKLPFAVGDIQARSHVGISMAFLVVGLASN